MMPSAEPITMISPPKPKIGFSIDSIVGKKSEFNDDSNEAQQENLPKLSSDLRREYSHLMKRKFEEENDEKEFKRLSESSDPDVQNNNQKPIVVPVLRPPMIPAPHSYHDLPPGHPHFLQFQAAAALVHAQAAQNGFNGALPQHLPHHLHNPNLQPRDSYPLYPWLLSRHGRIFPHRFPGSE
jgi:hypothetical protein